MATLLAFKANKIKSISEYDGDGLSKDGLFEIVECNELEDYYKQLECDYFDIATRMIDGEIYDIYCDDEGLLKSEQVVSLVDNHYQPALVGNLIFARSNEKGETVSLTDEDVEIIKKSAVRAVIGGKWSYVINHD